MKRATFWENSSALPACTEKSGRLSDHLTRGEVKGKKARYTKSRTDLSFSLGLRFLTRNAGTDSERLWFFSNRTETNRANRRVHTYKC